MVEPSRPEVMIVTHAAPEPEPEPEPVNEIQETIQTPLNNSDDVKKKMGFWAVPLPKNTSDVPKDLRYTLKPK
jgi:hypothetical protein